MDFELVVEEPGRRDLLWEALLEECGVDGRITRSARGAYNRVVGNLRRVRATPEDVKERAKVYRVRFPHAALTPTALDRHWAELRPPKKQRTDSGAYCDVCGELAWMPGSGRMRCRCG